MPAKFHYLKQILVKLFYIFTSVSALMFTLFLITLPNKVMIVFFGGVFDLPFLCLVNSILWILPLDILRHYLRQSNLNYSFNFLNYALTFIILLIIWVAVQVFGSSYDFGLDTNLLYAFFSGNVCQFIISNSTGGLSIYSFMTGSGSNVVESLSPSSSSAQGSNSLAASPSQIQDLPDLEETRSSDEASSDMESGRDPKTTQIIDIIRAGREYQGTKTEKSAWVRAQFDLLMEQERAEHPEVTSQVSSNTSSETSSDDSYDFDSQKSKYTQIMLDRLEFEDYYKGRDWEDLDSRAATIVSSDVSDSESLGTDRQELATDTEGLATDFRDADLTQASSDSQLVAEKPTNKRTLSSDSLEELPNKRTRIE